MKLVKDISKESSSKPQVSDKEAEEAIKKILTWIGEDPTREGLIETPKRVVKAFKEYFKGYSQNAESDLSKTFGDVDGYDDMVIQKNISIQSHCEHHMAPIIGKAHVAYLANEKIIGLSKINRIVSYFSKRPQVQEKLTVQIVNYLKKVLETENVACVIEAQHLCVSMRGIKDETSLTTTAEFSGKFLELALKNEFLTLLSSK